MYPFSQSVHPAVRTHLDAQTAFMNDMSKSLFQSFQQMCDLNIQLVQTMHEETTLASQQLLTAERQSELFSAAASRAQPARVTEQHVQNTTRTARALADEVARTASEETERGLRKQQDTVQRFVAPFVRQGFGGDGEDKAQGNDGAQMQGNGGAQGQSGPIQSGSVQRGDGNPAGSQAGKGAHNG